MSTITDFRFLTISIPTYNRKDDLEFNISNLLPQVLRYSDKARIFVSDNSSTDGTTEMLHRYSQQYPDIVYYYRQERNITASPNFRYVASTPNSDYIYLLGDDDVVCPDFLETIFGIINKHPDVGWIHFNFFLGKDGLKDCELNNRCVEYPFVKTYESGDGLIRDYLNVPSFISSNVFKRDLWIEGMKSEKLDCPGYEWYSILLYGSLKYKAIYYSLPLCIALFSVVGSNYSRLQVWYYVYGMGNLFRYLNNEVEGVYQMWIEKQQGNKTSFLQLLSTVGLDKNLYKNNASTVKPFIQSKWDRFYYDICCRLPKVVSVVILNKAFRFLELTGMVSKKLFKRLKGRMI